MRRVVILGAGGHARVVCDTLRQTGYQVVGFTDDNTALWGTQMLGLPILGPNDQAVDLEIDGAIVAIGDNHARRIYYEKLLQWDIPLVSAIHPSAIIGAEVQLGQGLAVMARVVMNACASVGNDAILNTACTIGHDAIVGHHVHVATGAHLCGGTRVGDESMIGVGAAIVQYKSVGAGTIIGGQALVAEDIRDHVLAVGVPARVIREL